MSGRITKSMSLLLLGGIHFGLARCLKRTPEKRTGPQRYKLENSPLSVFPSFPFNPRLSTP